MKKTTEIIGITLLAWILLSCDCIMEPIENEVGNAKFIITGKVVELLDTKQEREQYSFIGNIDISRSYRVKLRVLNSFKGNFRKGQIIELGSNFSNCNIRFNENGEYLLFLEKKQNKYFQKYCSYSEKLQTAEKTIEKIKKITNSKNSR